MMQQARSDCKSAAVIPQKPPQPNTLSLAELCQQFIDLHCTGNTELARPFLAELIRRNEYQRTLQALVGQGGCCGS